MNFETHGSDGEGESALNLTSLIDVMFLLVIFFAVSTTFRIHPGLSVHLPTARSERIPEEKHTVQAVLTKTGEVYLDGEAVGWDRVLERLKRKRKASGVTLFLLEADAQALHGRVVALMDAAREAGIRRLAIATRPKGEARGTEEGEKR